MKRRFGIGLYAMSPLWLIVSGAAAHVLPAASAMTLGTVVWFAAAAYLAMHTKG